MKRSVFCMACLGALALVLAKRSKKKQPIAEVTENVEKPVNECETAPVMQEIDEQPTVIEAAPEAAPEVVPPQVCFYTEKGGKWHTNIDCRYLKNSAEIFESSVEGANYAGKIQPCSICAAAYIEK